MSRVLRSAAAGLLMIVLASGLAIAKSPHTIDSSTLTPPLNPDFTWDCWETGGGITCQGTFVDGPGSDVSGIVCDGEDVFVHWFGHSRMTRWHDVDGRATKTTINISYPGDRFTLSADGSGPAVTLASHSNRHFTYLVPGDRDSRVLTERGAIYVLKGTDGKILMRDVGQVEFGPGVDSEIIVRSPGQHDLYDNWFATFESTICDELT